MTDAELQTLENLGHGDAAEEIRDLRAELAASREREARMQWQPIETAPTDGARILLCGKGGKIADGYYGQPDGFANPKQFVWPYIRANPTHWMPLQAPPAALAEGAQEPVHRPVHRPVHQPVHGELNNEA